MDMDDVLKFTGCLTLITTIIFVAIIQPIVSATFAFIGIYAAIWIIPVGGEIVVVGLRSLGLSDITLVQLPAIAASLAFVGSYFRSSVTYGKK